MENYRSALIVGAGTGLSASLARLFQKQGLRVALAARRIDKLAGLLALPGVSAHTCDAAEAGNVARLFETVEAMQGPPDVVVYNASGRERGPLVELDPAAVQRAIAITAFGGFLVSQQAAKRMLPQGRGAILLTGATAGVKGLRLLRLRLRHGQVRPARAGAVDGPRTIAAGHPCRPFRHRRRHPQLRSPNAGEHPRQHARAGCDRGDLLARDAAASQRLELGGGGAALGGEVLARLGSAQTRQGPSPWTLINRVPRALPLVGSRPTRKLARRGAGQSPGLPAQNPALVAETRKFPISVNPGLSGAQIELNPAMITGAASGTPR